LLLVLVLLLFQDVACCTELGHTAHQGLTIALQELVGTLDQVTSNSQAPAAV
jgi:hypothetical protein